MIWPIIFAIVFVVNIIPIFAPPTWLVLSFIAVYYNINNILFLALVGALAATLGRLLLASLSDRIIRNRFLSESSKKNIDDIRRHLETKKALTFSIFLFYAFSPFPSSQLFIAYGLTEMPLPQIALPFFLGRLASYTVLSFTSFEVSKKLAYHSLRSGSFFGGYFIFSQILTIITIYFFVKVDWHYLFTYKRLRLIK